MAISRDQLLQQFKQDHLTFIRSFIIKVCGSDRADEEKVEIIQYFNDAVTEYFQGNPDSLAAILLGKGVEEIQDTAKARIQSEIDELQSRIDAKKDELASVDQAVQADVAVEVIP